MSRLMASEWRRYIDSHAGNYPGDADQYEAIADALAEDIGVNDDAVKNRIAQYVAAIASWSELGAFEEGQRYAR